MNSQHYEEEFKLHEGQNFEDFYELNEVLGSGKFGTVYKCKHKRKGDVWAAKIIKTIRSKDKDAVKRELEIMSCLRHSTLLRCLEAYQTQRKTIMVMECITGGELFERITGDDIALTEGDCINFMRQICYGVQHIHENNILHLDLKPENIMCLNDTGYDIKIIDFGLAQRFKEGDSLKVLFGTPEFVAPEIVRYENIGFGTDMWAVGVICYTLLSGLSPFMGDDDSETLNNVTKGLWDFEDEAFDEISKDAKNFIEKLLVFKKEGRMTATHCLEHSWLTAHERTRHSVVSHKLSTERLKKFVARRRWQKTTHAVRAIGRMSILRLATQQRKLSVSPSSSAQTEGKDSDDKISTDKNNSVDKSDHNYNQRINDSPTKTTESKRMEMEVGSSTSHPYGQLEYPSLSSERITNEGFPSVTVMGQKDLIDEGSQPTGHGEGINKDAAEETQKNITRALNAAGYGFNTTNVLSINTGLLRERKIRSHANVLPESSKVPLGTSLDSEIVIHRHTSNEVEDQSLEEKENLNDTEGGEVRDLSSVREGIRNEEVKNEESIGTGRTKDDFALQPREQQPVLKSILKRRPKSPVYTNRSNLSDSEDSDKSNSSKSRFGQISTNSNKQSEASKRDAGLWELSDSVSATETTFGDTKHRSRKDLWIAEAYLTNQELSEGKEQAIMNGNLNKQEEKLRSDDEQGVVIALSEQTSRSFEVNSGTPVLAAVELSEQTSSKGDGRISVGGGSVQKKPPLLVEGHYVNDSAKSTRVETDDERYSTSSCSSDSHEPFMQPLSSLHSHPNAMESYLSHKRGTRSSSPYSRRIGNMSADDSNNNVSSKQVVAQAPVFLQKFHHVEVGLPATFEIKFECKIDGYPKPEVLWYKDGKRVYEGHDRYKFQSGPNGWFSLIIPRAMENDKGSFMCEARNSAGKARCSAKLILLQDSADTDGSLSPKPSDSGQRNSRSVSTSFFKSVSASLSGSRKSRRSSYEDKLQSQTNSNTDEKPKGSSQIRGTLGESNSYLQKLRRISASEDSEAKSNTLPRRSSSVNPKVRRRSPSVERASRKFEKLDQQFDQNPGRKKEFFTMMRPRTSISSLTAKFELNSDQVSTNGSDKPRPKLSRSESIGKSSLDQKRSLFKSNDKENGWSKETTKTPPPVRIAVLTQTPSTSALVSKFQNQSHSKQQSTPSKVRSSPFCQANNKAAILAKFESNSSPPPKQELKSVTVTLKPKFNSNPPKPVLTTDIDDFEFSPPSFVVRPSDQSNFETDSAKFVCQVEGAPKPKVSWHFRGSALKDEGRFEIYEEKGEHVLEIHELESSDAGLYTCRVQNASGRVSASVQLEVNVKPKSVSSGRPPVFLQKMADVEILEAEKTATFVCKVTGTPKPEVTWLIEGKSLKPGPRHNFEQNDDGRCALVITNVVNDDDAIYTCLAKNNMGQACCSAELVVDIEEPTKTASSYSSATSSRNLTSNTPSSYTSTSQRPSVENQQKITKPPEFVARPQSLTATQSAPAHFSCIVRGKPEPEITWEKDGLVLNSNESYNIHTEEGMSLLKILKTSRSDEGKYFCKAKNEVGSTEAAFEVQLEVSSTSDEPDGDIPRSGSVESVEDSAEDQLFISEDVSSSTVPKKSSVLSDHPSTIHIDENTPEFQITVSMLPQSASTPPVEDSSSERDAAVDTTTSSQALSIPHKRKTAPEFIELPKSISVKNNGDASFLCMIQGDPKPNVDWKKDGETLTKDNRYDFSEEEEEVYLKIHDVTQDDQGLYTCTLTNSEGEVSASAELTVEVTTEPPTFIEKPRDCHVNDGEKAIFSCKVKGEPLPTVQWLYQGQPLPSDGEVYVVTQSKDISTLTLLDVIVDDEGEYVASVTNSSGEVRCSAKLTVTAPPPKEEKKEPKNLMEAPSFTQPLESDIEAIDGAPLSLAVRIAGKPKPKMSWFFNGEQIKEDEDFKFVEDGERYSLVIAEVFPDDGGQYICRISNEAGSEECSANVVVKEPVQEGTPPSFAQKPRSVSTDEGCSISLNCHVAGDLPILVTWYKDGQQISHGKRFKLETSGPEGLTRTLHIPAVLATDAGSYLCTIENKFGMDKCTVSIVVKQLEGEQTDFRSLLKTRPRLQNLSNSPNNTSTEVEQFDFRHVLTRHVKPRKRPQITKFLNDQRVDEGKQAVFECNIDGNPEPRISWLHDRKDIKESKFFRMTYNETVARLEISEAFSEDEGEYECIAVNSAGETRCSAKLKVKRADSENNVSERRSSRVVQPVLNGRHSVSDTLSEESPVRKMSSTLNITLSPPVKSKPMNSVTLELDTNSLVSVTAPSNSNNAEETGSSRHITRGDSTDISTDFDDYEPPKPAGKCPEFLTELKDVHFVEGAPARLRCKVTGEPKPDLTWYKDETELKEGKKYKVDVFEEEVILTVRDTTEMDAGNYRLMARNSTGKAETSADLLVTAPPTILHAPGPLRVALGETISAECKFSGAPQPAITWKKLRRKIQNSEKFVITSSEHSTVLAINDVEERDAGRYTLLLENDLGSDEAIISVSVVGQPDPPMGKPIVSSIDSSSVVLSWSGSSYDGGSRITGYVIESRKSLETKWQTREKVNSTSHKVKGLDPDTEYHFRVRAENDFGTSDAGRMTEMVRTSKTEDIGNGYRTRARTRQSRSESRNGNGTPKKLVIKSEDEFSKHYELKEQVGKGRFGTVYSCVEKATGKRMAAKFISVTPNEKDEVKSEIGLMQELHHPKLLACHEAFEGSKQLVMVLEFISGGELFERVIDDDFVLTESDVIKYMRQVCEGVKHMHDRKILHLDLKPENIMCVDNSGSDVKLIDFGLARKFDPNEGVKVMSGTPEFVAPEVINFDEIGYTTDMWSVGVIAYILLSGLSPFMGDDDSETLSNVTLGEWDFEDEAFDEISEEAKEFISKLLVKEKEKRMTAEEALQHKWLNPTRHSKATTTKISTTKLKKFVARRRWQKTTNALRAVNRMSSLASTLTKDNGSVEDETDSKKSKEAGRNGSITLTSVDKSGDTDSESMASSLSTTSAYSSGAVSNKQDPEQCDGANKSERDSQGALDETDENENKRSSSVITMLKPKFTKTIVDCIVFEGDCARFDCVIEGKPEPEISWYLDEELIEESDRFIMESDEDGLCSLIIRNAEENDEGDYVVIAKNEAGQVSCAAELLVEMTGEGF